MTQILYDIVIRIYYFVIWVLSPFHPRARTLLKGRKLSWPNGLKLTDPVWVHAASLGEFEQGRPLIEEIKKRFPNQSILLTFYSPSGYEARRNYELADRVVYLPFDTRANAMHFVDFYNPSMAIFVKYDFWLNHLHVCIQRSIPVVFISSVFRANQPYFTFLKRLYLPVFSVIDHFFVQDELSAEVLKNVGIHHVETVGDTRLDSVIEQSKQAIRSNEISALIGDKPVLILGSVEQDDLIAIKGIVPSLEEGYQLIIVPHEVDEDSLKRTQSFFTSSVRYSELIERANEKKDHPNILVDKVGLLAALYQFGCVAFVGGGAKGMLHNLLEPAAFGKPILFIEHKRNWKFVEVAGLVKSGAAFSCNSSGEVVKNMLWLQDQSNYQSASDAALAYLYSQQGATKKIMQYISQKLS